ncbi:MAG TPA: hypothetical protein VFP86_21055 [bacterium]|nr:hypothetical protein [bacterium]
MKRWFLSQLRVWPCGVALVLCCLVVISSALPLLAAGAPEDDKMTVTADRVEYNSQTRIVRADGHVRATGRDTVIVADHLEANLDAQEVMASGNVTLTQSGTTTVGNAGLLRGEKVVKGSLLRYNLRTAVGHFEQASGQVGFWHVSGETIDLSPEKDVATGASITSCDPDHPLYKVTAKRIEIVPNDHFTAYNASLWVAGIRVVTLPSYTATARGRSGPSVGYNTLDGAYLEYANSFPLGSWRDEYRIRLATTTGLSAENIISQRFDDHIWRLALGRTQVYDFNLNLVNVDRYALDLEYDSKKIPGWPIGYQVEAHAGSYGEPATGVTTTRVEAIATVGTDTFVLSPGLYFSASGRFHYDIYGTGQQRTVIEGQTALVASLSPKASTYLSYTNVGVNGSTPFIFDSYTPISSLTYGFFYTFGGFVQIAGTTVTYDFPSNQTTLGLYLSMNITPTTLFNISGYYNTTTQQISEVDYALNIRCDCATFGIVYRTYPQSPGSNNFLFMVQFNALGPNSTF